MEWQSPYTRFSKYCQLQNFLQKYLMRKIFVKTFDKNGSINVNLFAFYGFF